MIMKMLDFIFDKLRDKKDQQFIDLVNNSYRTLNVTERGSIKIDSKEVYQSKEFRIAQRQAKEIVSQNRR